MPLPPSFCVVDVQRKPVSTAHSASQPSPPTVLLSSHASAVERMPLPQMCTTGVTVTVSEVVLLVSSSVDERLPTLYGVAPSFTTVVVMPTLSRRRRLVAMVEALTSMAD